jgi:hypothetical protein
LFRLGVQVDTMPDLAAAGPALMRLFAITRVFYVYRDHPYVDVRTPMIRLRAGSRA